MNGPGSGADPVVRREVPGQPGSPEARSGPAGADAGRHADAGPAKGRAEAGPAKSRTDAGPTKGGADKPDRAARRARRHDPERKDRIIDATIRMIARHGVAGTTHRLIAAAADVPLGSLTYHFTGLDDLRAQAFRRHAERMSAVYAARFEGVRTRDEFVEAVTELIHGDAGADQEDWAIAYELYLAALRDPVLREVTESWMRTSRSVLERFVDPITARGVDALIEGLVMHKTLATTPVPIDEIREIVRRAVGRL